MPSDISVTINPPNSPSVTIGGGVSIHGGTHAPGGVDSLESYYYPRSNPSGYATSGDFATTAYVDGVSGYLYGQISFPSNAVFTTGDQGIGGIKNFTSRPTVNGTGVLLSGEASAANTGYLTGYVQKTETGNFITTSQTGGFYPSSNPSGFITGVDLSNYVLKSQTGSFATTGYATGISGYLQSEIAQINSTSGAFLTTGAGDNRYVTGSVVRPSETGSFLTAESDPIFAASTAYGINSTLTGQWGVSYNDSITGIGVAGTSSKTITLYQRDGTTLTAIFTDIEGTGGGGTDNYLTGASFNSSNGDLTLYINDGSTVAQSLDGRYVTGNVVRPSDTGNFITQGQTGQFYSAQNPSGFITGVDLSSYSTISFVTGISGYQSGLISTLQGNTGLYALKANTGSFLTTGAGDTRFYPLNTNPSGYLTTGDITGYATIPYVTGVSGALYQQINDQQVGILNLNARVSTIESDYPTTGYVTGVSGYLQTQITSIKNGTGNFITGVDLSAYQTISSSTGISGYLQSQISSINSSTGSFVTGQVVRPSETGNFVITSQTGSFLTGVDLSSYATTSFVTGISGYQSGLISALYGATGLYALKSNTGAFLTTGAGDARYYPLSSNPSSYLVAADVASFATTGYVTGISGYLNSKIDATTAASYLDGITGIAVSGTTTKTVSIYNRAGSVYSAEFTDLQGTGGSVSDVVYLTGDQNISGVKNFISRPTAGGTGVILSGEIIPVVREIYIDAGAMLTGVSGATPTIRTISSSMVSYDCYSFDPTNTGYAQFKCSLGDYNLGAIKVKFDWTTSGSSGAVVWGVQSSSIGDGDSIAFTWGSGQEVTDTFITGTSIHQTQATSSLTPSGSPQAGDTLFFRVYRNTFSAADTLATSSDLMGVSIQYTGKAITAW